MTHRASLARDGAEHAHDCAEGCNLQYQAANCLAHVENAWRLVYERYVGSGLITPNPYGIYTSPRALHGDSCVVFGQCRDSGHLTSTMTLIGDSPEGLSLDTVYRRELKALRKRGSLLEVGLLVAECRATVSRDITALFELMKWGVYYALDFGVTDIVIGVHPRHAKFYTRWFGFEQFAPAGVYPMVRNKPVVPLRLPVKEKLAQAALPRGLGHVRDNPVHGDAFTRRYRLRPQELLGSLIGHFMTHKHGDHWSHHPLSRPHPQPQPQPQPVMAAAQLV